MNRCIAGITLGAVAALSLAGLGACAASGDSDQADGGTGLGCWMRAAVSPSLPQAPATMELTASIDIPGEALAGFRTYAWSVWFGDTQKQLTPLDVDGARVAFLADAPGVYRLVLDGAVGMAACVTWSTSINVVDPGAAVQSYRLRLIPPGGQELPIQEIPQSLVTGADVSLGTVLVSPGVAVTGTVETASGAPLSAYLRVSPRGAIVPWFVESFAGAGGAFSLRLEAARYDMLVVPLKSDHAPILLADQVATSPLRLVVAEAPALAGHVFGADEQPLAGAQVSVGAGDVPAVLAITDNGGAFAVPVRPGSAVGMTVVPPAATGLPWLELPASSSLSDSAGLATITYTPGRDVVSVVASARAAGGDPLPGARATWVARPLGSAGLLILDGKTEIALDGTMRATVTADAGGAFPAIALPAGLYDVILEPAEQGPGAQVSLLSFDLTQAAPASLAVVAPALLTGTVVDDAGAPIAGAEVAAVALDLLAGSVDAGARAQTAADGSFSLEVTAGGAYDLVVDGSLHGAGRITRAVDAPVDGQSGAVGAISLPPVTRASGRLLSIGSGVAVAGVTVQLLCATCSAPGDGPLAEAVSDAFGDFTLRIPR
jgi:hypothetical protein